MRLVRYGVALLGLVLVCGCAEMMGTSAYMNVTAYPDPERPIVAPKRFATVVVGQTTGGPMLEKNLLALVKERLVAKGFVYDESDPELVVALTGFIGPFEEYVPPSTTYWPMPTSTTSRTQGSAYGSDGSYASGNATTQTQGTQYIPITRNGYTVTQYYRAIDVMVASVRHDPDSVRVEPVWTGSVTSSGSTGDLLTIAPVLLDELVGEFPARTGKPSARQVLVPPQP